MARRRKAVGVAAKVRKTGLRSSKNENEMEEDTSESVSTEENQEVPIVHHKKFGDIHVKTPELCDNKMDVTHINGCAPPSSTDDILNSNEAINSKNIINEEYNNLNSPVIKPNEIISQMPSAELLNQIDSNSIAFMNVIKGIKLLRTTLSNSVQAKDKDTMDVDLEANLLENKNNLQEETSDELKIEKQEDSLIVEDDLSESPKDDEPRLEIKEEIDDSVSSEATIIRRSTRIRHIGILKKKEKVICVSPDLEKPVKVKSRWRRSSELELHTSDSPGPTSPTSLIPEPETEEQLIERLAKEKRERAEGMRTFVPIIENEYRTERNICREAKKMNCDCVLSKEEVENGESGCGDDCLNRMLFIECGQKCALGDRCTNKCFQRKSYGLCKIFKTEKKGFGLRAEKLIPGNSFIMEYVGEVVDQKEFAKRVKNYAKDEVKHFYFMALKGDTVIDATSKGNISRFINHSCDPNAETQKWTVNGELRIGFFTKRPVQAGEEITFDYKFQRYGKEAQKCYCEASQCRGWIGENPDDESDEESEEESDEESEEEEEDDDEGEEEEGKADEDENVTDVEEKIGEDTSEVKSELPIDVESPEIKVKPKRKPREPKIKKPKTPAEKKQGRGRRKKEVPVVEDLGLEEEIQRLTITGLKNRAHTLMLSRLMIRAEDWSMRSRILHLIQTGDGPCRRLFLDYHGLRFLYAWMQATMADSTDTHQRRLEILNTLETLPIPHKTMLIDSKILTMVEEWHGTRKCAPNYSPDGDSGESEITKPVFPEIEGETSSSEMKISPTDSPASNSDKLESCDLTENNNDDLINKVQKLAKTLLDSWSLLKEVFKIPKKERMEQMKEHEREADRGYRQSTSSKEDLDKLYKRYKIDRISERDREKGRERWDFDRKRSKDGPDWLRNHRYKRMTKQERRQMFALQVLREDEAARQRMQQEELWSQHKARCEGLGLDPTVHPAMDPISGCPIFFDQNTRSWAPYPPYNPPPPRHLNSYPMPPNGMASAMPYPMISYGGMNGPYPTPSPSIHMTPVYQSTPPILYQSNIITLTPEPPPPQSVLTPPDCGRGTRGPDAPALTPVPVDAPIRLPPRWKVARDSRGHAFYYHIKERKSQWEPPSWTEDEARQEALRTLAAEAESSSDSSESESEDEQDEDDQEETETREIETETPMDDDVVMSDQTENMQLEVDSSGEDKLSEDEESGDVAASASAPAPVPAPAPSYSPIDEPNQLDNLCSVKKEANINDYLDSPLSSTTNPKNSSSKRRAGLVQERIISPRHESSRRDSKRYKEIKLMLKKRKEEKRKAEKLKLKSEKVKSKSERRKRKKRLSSKPESSTDKKIKENFKLSIASDIVGCLNPYRKLDCKKGRITSNDDFKHLARKLTHFVMVKELRHCQNIDDLQCNDSVVVKARDFIKKYMSKFGKEYERSIE